MNEEQVEKSSLADLAAIIHQARKLRISLVLIGGYAVAAYTRGYRYTKNIDLVADKPGVGRLRGLLSSLGYSIRQTEFGLAGSKQLNQGFIDLHISVGNIHHISTDMVYPVDSAMFKSAETLEVKGYYSKTSSLSAPVVDVETLLVLKLMTVGRQKDTIDILSLLLDKRDQIDPILLVRKAGDVRLKKHLLDRVRDYARRLGSGELDEIWFSVTASRLPHVEKLKIRRFFRQVANSLRQP